MAAKFEIQELLGGQFRWVLTSQGRILATSDPYEGRAACLRAMESFRKAAPGATVVDQTVNSAKAASPQPAAARVARTTGRVMGKAAATVAKVFPVGR